MNPRDHHRLPILGAPPPGGRNRPGTGVLRGARAPGGTRPHLRQPRHRLVPLRAQESAGQGGRDRGIVRRPGRLAEATRAGGGGGPPAARPPVLPGEAARARGGVAPEAAAGGRRAGGLVAGAAGVAPAGAGAVAGPSRAAGAMAQRSDTEGPRRGGILAASLAAFPIPPPRSAVRVATATGAAPPGSRARPHPSWRRPGGLRRPASRWTRSGPHASAPVGLASSAPSMLPIGSPFVRTGAQP
jgi:hypothetical protein